MPRAQPAQPSAVSRLRPVLMVAYHFPPLAGSSGIQRTLRFVQHLPALGWQPLVLSIHPMAYERTSQDLLAAVPDGTVVRRAFGFDTARHLSIAGRYVGAWARPDRWQTWRFDGVRQGMALIRKYRPVAIWSTFPVATAHEIGYALHARSGLPWIADFRDPMAQDGYPSEPKTRQAYKRVENLAFDNASACVFTTPGAARMYSARYPARSGVVHLIENGYDEESFASAEAATTERTPLHAGAVTLLHSGIVYPEERDPRALLQAIGLLARTGKVRPENFRLRFRAAVHDDEITRMATDAGVVSYLDLLPAVGYREALQEMLRADGLLVLQSAGCNAQVPAKLYEYLRANRPIICLSDDAGDTAGILRAAGMDSFASMVDPPAIATVLERFVDTVRTGRAALPLASSIASASRSHRSAELASLLQQVCA